MFTNSTFNRRSIARPLVSAIAATLCLFSLVVIAQAQGSQQNTTSAFQPVDREFKTRRHEITQLHLTKASGEHVVSSAIVDSDNDGKLSDTESVFYFGALPAGDYVLTLTGLQGQVSGLSSDLTARVSITGAVGKVEKDWKVETQKASSSVSENQRLGGLSSDFGQFNVSFKADGNTRIAGRLTLPTGTVLIKNIRRPN